MGSSHEVPLWTGAPLADQGAPGVVLVGNTASLPSNISGKMISRGNRFPRHSPLPDTRRGVPPPIFRPCVVFSLHEHDFIG